MRSMQEPSGAAPPQRPDAGLAAALRHRSRATPPVWPFVLAGLVLPLLWDSSGLDLALAQSMGDPQGFALRRSWWLTTLAHDGGRLAALAMLTWICAGITWPLGPLRRLARRQRIVLAVAVLLALMVPGTLKQWSLTSCPWDLQLFGGHARYVGHWQWGVVDGGSGHCFPAGHAATGFAFIAGWFAFREVDPGLARRWLWLALGAGLVMGLGQQWRGAHYLSHTLWTAWLCAATAWAVHAADVSWRRRGARPGARGPVKPPGRS